MAQVFISHSKADTDLKDFMSRLFATTGDVKGCFEEWEGLKDTKPVNGHKIETDIRASEALFLLLSKNVESLPHTRDWVQWETGVAKGAGKEIWVFEPAGQIGSISLVTPSLHHLVIYAMNDPWQAYLAKAVHSFGRVGTVGLATAAGTAIGALLAGGKGAAVGGALGLGLSLAATNDLVRPQGMQFKCGACGGQYAIHIPQGLLSLRCPVCNTINQLSGGK